MQKKYIELIPEISCVGCQACLNVCPSSAISMVENGTAFLFPKIKSSKCIDCGLCKKVCPAINEYLFEQLDDPICYAAWSNDNENIFSSSSGGVFSELASLIIRKKGVVYGAAFDDNFNLKHIACNSIDNLNLLRGSKYLQSDINNTYKQTKIKLKDNVPVLFCGTPCQVAGLNNFLQKDYSNLITCDFICHGVPSQQIFSDYIKELEIKNNSKVSSFYFRRKKEGWKNFNFDIQYESGLKEKIPFTTNSFMKGFLNDLYLRPSCYNCKYSRIPRVADITLGDFWGVWDFYPHLYNKMGVSAILINSSKGKFLFSEIQTNLFFEQVSLDSIIKGNPSIISSVKLPKKRKQFYKLYNQGKTITEIMAICFPPPTYLDKLKWSINRRINKWRKIKK